MKRKKVAALIMVIAIGSTTGCGGSKVQQASSLLLQQEEETETTYSLLAADRGDVISSKKMECVYQEANQEELKFAVSGKKVSKVYVEKGDTVKAGQLLAEIDCRNLEDDIRTQAYQKKRNELLLAQARQSMEYELSMFEQGAQISQNNVGMTGAPMQTADQEFIATPAQNDQASQTDQVEKMKNGVKQKYQYQMEDYEDAAKVASMRLEKLQDQKNKCYLHANMSGTISYMKNDLTQADTDSDEIVFRISGEDAYVFTSDDMEFKDKFDENSRIEIEIKSKGSGTYEVIPEDISGWSDKMKFVPAEGTDTSQLEAGASGIVKVVEDIAKDVVRVPVNAVHKAEDKSYVYILDEDQLRQVQWVETGVEGNEYIEIKDGIKEGDKVIVR